MLRYAQKLCALNVRLAKKPVGFSSGNLGFKPSCPLSFFSIDIGLCWHYFALRRLGDTFLESFLFSAVGFCHEQFRIQ